MPLAPVVSDFSWVLSSRLAGLVRLGRLDLADCEETVDISWSLDGVGVLGELTEDKTDSNSLRSTIGDSNVPEDSGFSIR